MITNLHSLSQSVDLDTKRSKGIAGSVLPDPICIPGSTFDSPLPSLNDIYDDKSISASFSFPSQRTPHRSFLLPGVKLERPVLTSYDKDNVRRGTGGGGQYESNGFHSQRGRGGSGPGFAKLDNRGGRGNSNDRGGGGRGGYNSPNRGGYVGQQQQGQGQQDPYNGYDSRRAGPQQSQQSYGNNPQSQSYGYQPPQQQQQNSYGQPPQQNSYGYGRPPAPGGGYQPPQQQQQYGAPPARYPTPPSYGAPPPFSYGGGHQQQNNQGRGGYQGGRGQDKR